MKKALEHLEKAKTIIEEKIDKMYDYYNSDERSDRWLEGEAGDNYEEKIEAYESVVNGIDCEIEDLKQI